MRVDISTYKHPKAMMLINKADYDYVKSVCTGKIWATKMGNVLYAQCTVDGKCKLVHSILMGTDRIVDHKNRNGLDNRRCNLRQVSNAQNIWNSKVYSTNKSGYRGVSKHKDKWIAQICTNKVKRHLGTFGTPKEASIAYEEAASVRA